MNYAHSVYDIWILAEEVAGGEASACLAPLIFVSLNMGSLWLNPLRYEYTIDQRPDHTWTAKNQCTLAEDLSIKLVKVRDAELIFSASAIEIENWMTEMTLQSSKSMTNFHLPSSD